MAALVKAYNTWKAGGKAVGQLPSRYSPSLGKMQEGAAFDFSVGGWELAGERPTKTQRARQDGGVDANIEKTLKGLGKHVTKQGKETQLQAGQRLVRDFAQIHRKLNTQMLNMAYPNEDHMVLYRGVGSISEVVAGKEVGLPEGLSPMKEEDLYKYGFP